LDVRKGQAEIVVKTNKILSWNLEVKKGDKHANVREGSRTVRVSATDFSTDAIRLYTRRRACKVVSPSTERFKVRCRRKSNLGPKLLRLERKSGQSREQEIRVARTSLFAIPNPLLSITLAAAIAEPTCNLFQVALRF
jgi:hypothetical protein